MAEDKNNPTPEELRRQIQERLESMKKSSDENSDKKEDTPEEATNQEAEPVNNTDDISSSNQQAEEDKTTEATDDTPEDDNLWKTTQEDTSSKDEVEKFTPKEENTPEEIKDEANSDKKVEAKVTPTPEKKTLGGNDGKKTLGSKDSNKKSLGGANNKKTIEKPKASKSINTPTKENQKSNKKGMVVLLIVLLIGVVGLFTWQLFETEGLKKLNQEKEAENISLSKEKESITKELKALYKEYENVTTSNATLKAQLDEEKQKIADYLKKIESLQGQANQTAYFRRELAKLKKSREEFVAQIDSLTNLNQALYEQNTKITEEIDQKSTENTMLSDKVKTAQRVKGFNLKVESYNDKGKTTDRSKRVDMFKVCITLMENELAEPGIKRIYVRIVEPGGDIMVKSKDNFFLDKDENELAYSAVGSIDYKNTRVETCITYDGMYGEVVPGNYDFEVYTDGQIIGATNISIR